MSHPELLSLSMDGNTVNTGILKLRILIQSHKSLCRRDFFPLSLPFEKKI
jgi:hypothetical protein